MSFLKSLSKKNPQNNRKPKTTKKNSPQKITHQIKKKKSQQLKSTQICKKNSPEGTQQAQGQGSAVNTSQNSSYRPEHQI